MLIPFMKNLRQSPQYAKYLESVGWKIEKIDNTFIFLKKLPALGWFVKIQRPLVLNDEAINFIEKKYHPFQISVEPNQYTKYNILYTLGFKKADPSLPTKTLILDLTKTERELLKDMSPKTRYNTRLSTKKRVTVKTSTDILDFTTFWRKNFEKKRFPFLSQQKNIIALHKTFAKNSHILLAKKDNQIIAVLFLVFFNKVSYYLYAASSDEGRSNFAPTLLTWHAILLAKKLGCKVFDFDGIYDERFPIKTWLGFTKFKKGFGGKEIEYPGRYTKS